MDKEVLIAIIGAISVMGAALITHDWQPDPNPNPDKINKPPVLDILKPDKDSPQKTGTAINWTATAKNPDDTSLYYRFILKGPSADGSWDEVQDWSTQSWWEWTPSKAGSYKVQVEVRDGDHAGPDGRDDSMVVSYVIEDKEAEKVTPAFLSEEDPAVAVSSWGPGRLDLFVRGTDDALYRRSMDGSTWSNWKCLGGKLNSAPAAVSRKPGSIDVFAIGNDNALWHIFVYGSKWGDWEHLGGNWTSAPAASSWGEDRLDVFVRGRDNALWHICYNESTLTWSDWESLAGNWTSAPAAISPGEGVIYVLVKDGDDDLKWKAYRWGSWTSWMQVPINPGMQGDINFTSAPAVISQFENSLEIFIRGDDNALLHSFWDGKQYRVGPQYTWDILSSGELASAPASVAWNINYVWVFAKGTDNNLIGGYWEPTTETWYGFDSIGKWPPE